MPQKKNQKTCYYIPDLTNTEEVISFRKYLRSRKTLLVSVDPGYDAYKIIINGEFFTKIRSLALVEDSGTKFNEASVIGEQESTLDGEYQKDIHITMKGTGSQADKHYIMGPSVSSQFNDLSDENREIIKSNAVKADRFFTESFMASYFGALYAAIAEYASKKNSIGFTAEDLSVPGMNGFHIVQVIALPHEYKEQSEVFFKSMLSGKRKGSVSSDKITVDFVSDFDEKTIFIVSQTLSAYYSTMYEPYGCRKSSEAKAARAADMEVLLLDAGRQTMGQRQIDKSGHVKSGDSSVEYHDFAMNEIEGRVAKEIETTYAGRLETAVTIPAVADWCSGKGQLQVRKEGGKRGYELVNVSAIREKHLEKATRELVDYIDRRYQINLLRSILVYGGTGSMFYPYLKSIYGNRADYPLINDVILLKGYLLDGTELGSEYAVSYGAYTFLSAMGRMGEL